MGRADLLFQMVIKGLAEVAVLSGGHRLSLAYY